MKDTIFCIRGWTLCILLHSLLGICVTASPYSQGRELWEGSHCQLEDGSAGECIKAVNCPRKMMDIIQGNYTVKGRCSFWHFDEIVCCEKNKRREVGTDRIRPAIVACESYKEWLRIIEKDKEQKFRTVVYNGVEADPGEFPQTVALGYPAGSDDELVVDGIKYVCGGTLISEKHVVTAAHCVSNVNNLVPVEVVLGTTRFQGKESGEKQRVPISKIIKHPNYRRSLYYNDIAVIELQHPVRFTDFVRPACLVTEPLKMPTAGSRSQFVVLGWGAIDIDGTRSTTLLKADWLEFVDKNNCSRRYENIQAQLPNGLDEGMVCVADPNTERKSDTCWGDSGGPLFLKANKFPPLVGVTSFGQACGSGIPGVYASIFQYLDWIEAQVWPTGATKSGF